MAALLLIGNLVFDLDAASTGLDHLLGQQVGRFGVTETSVDISDDRHNVSFVVIDLSLDFSSLGVVTGFASVVKGGEQQIQFTSVSLAQEGVKLFDQRRHRGFLVHGLVWQRAEFGAQCSNHPTRQVQVALVSGFQVLLDGDQLLLTDEAVPATQRLGVDRGVGVVFSHILAHYSRGVLGNIQTGLEAVLRTHASDGFWVDSAPATTCLFFQLGSCFDVVLIS